MGAVTYQIENGIALLTIDNPPVNAMSHGIRIGLCEGLQRAYTDAAATAIVLVGAGKNFIAGVDIKEFGKPRLSPTIRDVLAIIEASPKPVVAAIDGFALGGGLELALTCHWRLATVNARVGLPEVKLGLIPGGGGTQRLPRLIGPERAMEMITSGKPVDAVVAQGMGIIDQVLMYGELIPAAVTFAQGITQHQQPLRLVSRMQDKVTDIDAEIFNSFRNKIERKARGLFSPWKCIDSIEAACSMAFDAGYQYEQDAFQACEESAQRGALIHLFFAERDARKIPDLPAEVKPLTINTAAVIGSGTMGGGIAMCFANADIPVKLLDVSKEALQHGQEIIGKNYATSVERGSLSQQRADQSMALIEGSSDYGSLMDVDIVVEAVFEEMEIKKKVFKELDLVTGADTILATNTSTLDIDEIAAITSRPEKFIGTHFFSPANIMKLLENVRGAKSSPQTIATVMALGKRLGKVPVLAGNCDGFIGNRLLRFYTEQAEFLLEEGATPQQVDRVITEFGFAMGPLAVRDLIGNDVGWLIRKASMDKRPRDYRVSPILQRLYEMERYGQKRGAGFYYYEGRKAIPDPAVETLLKEISIELGIERREIDDEEILARLLHPLVNEGVRIVEEGIAARSSDIDVVYVNGYGFPAYKGGPMFWGETIGLEKIYQTMLGLEEKLGATWAPAPLLKRMVEEGKGWAEI